MDQAKPPWLTYTGDSEIFFILILDSHVVPWLNSRYRM